MFKLPIKLKINDSTNKLLLETSANVSELNGLSLLIPNNTIILNALTLTEAKESSAIENIFTTYDELYKKIINVGDVSPSTKEVLAYRSSLLYGIDMINDKKQINLTMINNIHDLIESTRKGIRRYDGINKVVIKNTQTNEIIYTPPQEFKEIMEYLDNLFHYIWKRDDLHPLIKVAIIHLQFERIHPYRDGNGRTGRILNILYLLQTKTITTPALYISKYIIENKKEYYELLNKAGNEQEYILKFVNFMLRSINITAKRTKTYILTINKIIDETKREINTLLPKIYSHELVELLFYDMYTRPKFLVEKLHITRKTADKYLTLLETNGFLKSKKIGKEIIFINKRLDVLIDLVDN